jgi:hypothetical protein
MTETAAGAARGRLYQYERRLGVGNAPECHEGIMTDCFRDPELADGQAHRAELVEARVRAKI